MINNNIKQFIPKPEKLEEELIELNISNYDKEQIKKLYNSWATCLGNKIIIEKLNNNEQIVIFDNIIINDIVLPNKITLKSTLHINNCSNINIYFKKKINHITIEHCDNINIIITTGAISGIDTINCKNINMTVINNDIYYIGIGKSKECDCYLQESLAINTLISSLNCYDIKLLTMIFENKNNINKMINIHKFQTNTSIFSSENWYSFEMLDKDIKLKFISSDSEIIREIKES